MISISKILVPIAFSPGCAWAARYASRLASHFRAELLFLHVSPSLDPERLENFLASQISDVPRRSLVLSGDPAEAIVSLAQQETAELILMPTHAHGRFRRFLLGSVTAKVLHDAGCPVWTGVHHQDVPPEVPAEFRTIVCAVDCDRTCVPVIQWARDLAAALQADLKVVHAVTAADETSDNRGEIELRRFLFERAQGGFVRWLGDLGTEVKVSLAGGPVPRVVREAVLRERAQLAVIGRGHMQGGLGRLQSCAYSIIRESPCPVVSI